MDESTSPCSSYVREWYPRGVLPAAGTTEVAQTAEADGGAPANAALKRSSSHRRLVMEAATAASKAMSTVVWARAWNETAGVPTSRCSSEDDAPGPSEE